MAEEAPALPVYKLADIAEHKSEKDIWLSIKGGVYNLTEYVNDHPGGVEIMMQHAGASACPFSGPPVLPPAPLFTTPLAPLLVPRCRTRGDRGVSDFTQHRQRTCRAALAGCGALAAAAARTLRWRDCSLCLTQGPALAPIRLYDRCSH